MQNMTHEMTIHCLSLATLRRLAIDSRQSLCARWRMVFGSRFVTWPRTARNEMEMPYSVIFSKCPTS